MPKIRGIKPDYWTDEDIVDLSIPARLLFIGLWSYACDNGHLQDKPKQIKMRVLPGDDVNVTELLRELEAAGRIQRGEGWITIPNFTKHQKPDRRYFTTCDKADCTEPPETVSQRESRRAPNVRPTGAQRANSVGTPSAHVDGDGDGDGDGEVKPPPASARRERDLDADPDFIAFWAAYPKREDKGHARKAWLTKVVRAKVDPRGVVAGAASYADRVRGADPKFTALPATWLNGERWTDEAPRRPEPADDPDAWMRRRLT